MSGWEDEHHNHYQGKQNQRGFKGWSLENLSENTMWVALEPYIALQKNSIPCWNVWKKGPCIAS